MLSFAILSLWLAALTPLERYEELDRQATAAMARGDYDKTAALAEQALAVARQMRDRQRESQALGRAANARLFQARYDQARTLFEQALELDRASGDRQGQVMRLNNLGSVALFQADYQKALEWYRAAERVLAEPPPQDWTARLTSATAVNVATLYQHLGLEQQALEAYRRMEPAASTLRAAEQAQRLSNLGAVYRHLGDPYQALECYQTARKLYAGDRDRNGELVALKNIGIAQALDLRNYGSALRTFDQVLALAEQTGNRRQAMQTRLYRAETLRRMGRPAQAEFEAALAAARALKTPEEEWKALFALGRAKEAAEVIENMREQAPGGAWREQFLAGKRDVYDALIERQLEHNDAAAFFEWSEKARARLLRDQLGTSLSSNITLAALRSRLQPFALLLVYWRGPSRGAVLWATRERSGLLARESGDSRELLEALSSPGDAGWRKLADAAGARLLGGIPPLAAGSIRQVIIVPDGLLQVVPFEALPVPGRSGLLVEQATVSYLPTASLLARRREHSAGWAPPWRRSLLALAAAQGVDPLAETGRLPVLPNAGREAEAIAHSLPGRTAVFTGDAAGKHALVAGVAEGVPLVHLAAHTAISEETPQRSRILLGRDALFLGEAAQLDMRRVDLVTLSACETERGRLVEGEGIASFSRAFLAAGARAVITTLWRVSDRPTASFMQALYHQLARGETKADALARAKREFLRSGGPLAHPYYWAAFVLNGEGWEPAPLPVSWAATLLASGALMLALAWWRRKRDRV